MSDESLAHSNKKMYLLAAAGALVFLLILPGIVLAIASNMSGIELISSYDPDSVPKHEIMNAYARRGSKTFWIRAQEGTTADDVKMISSHLIRTEKKSISGARFYYFVRRDLETKAFRELTSDNIDYSVVWSRENGFRVFFDRSLVSPESGSGRRSGPPSFPGFDPRRR